jgi:DNA-binding CsgD family transcriptional regulator
LVVLRQALSKQNTPFVNLPRLSDRPVSPQVKKGKRNYRPNRRLTPAERTQLAEQYQLGLSALDLARQYGINRHTVTKHLKREGITLRGGQPKLTPDVIVKATHLYATGQSLASIGAHLGVDASTVHKALKKADVKMRDTHRR